MEPLDKLKNDWKKNGGKYPKFSEKEIYAMLHKGSSSIVKWILIISILEFIFWIGLSFLMKDSQGSQRINNMHIDYITIPMTILSYGIIIYFAVVFYLNYKKINATDNAKTLMVNILKTRKAVSNYIFINLAYMMIGSLLILVLFFYYDPSLINALHQSEENGDTMKFYLVYFGLTILLLGVFIFIVWLLYKLIYGTLLKRLKRNYNELKKLDF
ncbi:hypothetical protein DVK85_12575 [Flavobacterium arcticum]|uniref:Beta-carotene 15,15'-monooxygenase n=1 Tax=Flavobacterium arcticum TaxID=1784713 RepID=A0A345HEL1_9FLAO|nr:hypothetical protein [Flavobacterium arcticum]AXG75021.1 hypothetical protein DVK85_12575 [Flavobacterium arcticum]KAF2506573.1 hypothetical protein E0W72_13150 [Flavobacterium arcticum]